MKKDRNSVSPEAVRMLRFGKGLGCLFLVVLVPLAYYGIYFVGRGQLPSEPRLIAHRGGRVVQPENTLAAFRQAVDLGVDFLEMDVQRTQDGVLVVIHDETVDRTTDGTGRVADMTLEQVRALDAGGGQQVPIFEEVIDLARETGVGLLPEAKSPQLYPGIEGDMLSALAAGEMLEASVIQSFDAEVLVAVKALEPQAEICPLYGLWDMDLSAPIPASSRTLCPMGEMVILYPWMIRQAHDQGRAVYAWFGIIESPWVMRFLLTLGVDGLMVDDPGALVRVSGREIGE